MAYPPTQHQYPWPQPNATRPTSSALTVLYLLTAVATLLAGVLPLASQGDGSLMSDGGSRWVGLLLIPIGLLLIAALGNKSNATLHALGGGAGVAVASMLGATAILLLKISEGKNLGAGTYMLAIAAVLGLIAFLASLGVSPRSGGSWGVLLLLVGAAASLGATLVPSKYSGMSWKQWNGFIEGLDPTFGIFTQIVIWGPVLAGLAAAARGGRSAGLYVIGGYSCLAWLVLSSSVDRADGDLRLPTDLHPLAIGGVIAVMVLGLAALVTSAARIGVADPHWASPATGYGPPVSAGPSGVFANPPAADLTAAQPVHHDPWVAAQPDMPGQTLASPGPTAPTKPPSDEWWNTTPLSRPGEADPLN